LFYVERCKEWLREMLRTSKRKKTPLPKPQIGAENETNTAGLDDEEDPEAIVEEDDIIIDDSDD
jgi:hypothetical protein